MIGMREHAHLLGGSLFVAGTPGYGTSITLDIPVKASDSDLRAQTGARKATVD